MSTEAARYGRSANLIPGCVVNLEALTKAGEGANMISTTPPTPLNDAHQGGYFFGRSVRHAHWSRA